MHKIKVDIIELEVFQGGIESRLDVGRLVGVIPELGWVVLVRDSNVSHEVVQRVHTCNEKLRARDATLLDGCTDCWLGAVSGQSSAQKPSSACLRSIVLEWNE